MNLNACVKQENPSHKENEMQQLYYKNITIINDTYRVVSEWHHNLECQLQSSIMLLELSIMLLKFSIMFLESSIMLLENI